MRRGGNVCFQSQTGVRGWGPGSHLPRLARARNPPWPLHPSKAHHARVPLLHERVPPARHLIAAGLRGRSFPLQCRQPLRGRKVLHERSRVDLYVAGGDVWGQVAFGDR
jgi:hypothetical protein